MTSPLLLHFTILGLLLTRFSSAFTLSFATRRQSSSSFHHSLSLFLTRQDLTEPQQKVYSLLEALHDSNYDFRIVVVGNGAILETTSKLGPVLRLAASPKTGQPLLTLASTDQSFEFHVQLAETSKVALTEKEGERRVIRFLNTNGAPMCSLILRDDSEQAVEWYHDLQATYGHDVQL